MPGYDTPMASGLSLLNSFGGFIVGILRLEVTGNPLGN